MQGFDAYTITGEQIRVNTSASDTFAARLQDPTTTPEQRATAAECLEWLAEQVDKTKNLPPLDQAAWRIVYELELSSILDGGYQSISETASGQSRRPIQSVPSD